jgi:hypothetical protein
VSILQFEEVLEGHMIAIERLEEQFTKVEEELEGLKEAMEAV